MPSKCAETSAKICKFCDESSHCRSWKIRFDKDILQTIKKKFPSWFLPLKKKSNCSIDWLPDIKVETMEASSSTKPFDSMGQQQEKRVSPPKAIVDSSPLALAMDKNRESLKVKLLVRRSAVQLVEQGILPPLKTSPAIHEQRKLLERAKTGDLLKAKIQQRPARQELERRHILESHEGHIDPSLADKYRMLEKAILVDQLNSKISHRPGPLELIEKNILHANEPIERIVKEGLVPFKVKNEDNLTQKNFLSFEDDSQSSESDLFQQSPQLQHEVHFKDPSTDVDRIPQELMPVPQSQPIFESLPTGMINISLVPTSSNVGMLTNSSTPIVTTFKIQSSDDKNDMSAISIPPPPPEPPKLITYHVKPVLQTQLKIISNNNTTQSFLPVQITETPITNVNTIPALVPSTQTAVNQYVSSFIQNNKNFSAPGKEKNRKKCKNKAVSKSRPIKFHEYKGPPNKCNSSSSLSSTLSNAANKKFGETNYNLIMQQQCLLEYLEGIYKNPNAKMLANKPESEYQKDLTKPIKIEKGIENGNEKLKTFNKPHVTIFPSKPSSQSSTSSSMDGSKDVVVNDVAKLSKMKVSELKAYLKRVNLPVSGPKPLLIERLKPYLPLKPLDDFNDDTSSICSNMILEGNDYYSASLHSVSSESDMDNNMDSQQCLSSNQVSSSKEDDIVAEQQRKIEELQRKLQQSQQELEQMKQHHEAPVPQKIIFEPQFQMPNQISTVFVVDVSQASSKGEEYQSSSPNKIKSEILLELPSSSNVHETAEENAITQSMQNNSEGMLREELSHCSQMKAEPSTSSLLTSPIPMSQDISDVLEILLKNGEWSDMVEDGKGLDFNHENILSSKHFIGDVLSTQNGFDVMSPMIEDPVSPNLQVTEESIDKILDGVAPVNENAIHGSFTNNFSQGSNMEFPMDIEEDTSVSLVDADFNRNVFHNADYSSKPGNMQAYAQHNHFNGLKMDNCDTSEYLKSVKNSHDDNLLIKSEHKSQKNGLIGNFDNNLFDTLKSNNVNNNNVMNELFLIPQEGKYAKDDSKSLINNLHLTNSFDMFSSAMDFESIIPYNDLQTHDSLFHSANFEHSAFSGHSFNDDTRMGESEVDNLNLLCNL